MATQGQAASAGPATEPASASAPAPIKPPQKRIHSLVVDTGPLIKNEPSTSTLIAQADHLYTIPSVLSEIKVSLSPKLAHGFFFSRCQSTIFPFSSSWRSFLIVDLFTRMPPPAPG